MCVCACVCGFLVCFFLFDIGRVLFGRGLGLRDGAKALLRCFFLVAFSADFLWDLFVMCVRFNAITIEGEASKGRKCSQEDPYGVLCRVDFNFIIRSILTP